MTQEAFDNAIVTLMAIGGSTNAIVHLMAMAGRARIQLKLERFDELSKTTPVVANLQPAGEFVMADFFDAGGLRGLMSRISHLLNTEAPTVAGITLGESIRDAEIYNDDVIRTADNPVCAGSSLAVLRGNLCPDGAIIKPSAADPDLLYHTGPAVVFADYADLKARIDDPALRMTADHVIVLQNAGPVGGPGIPEWGMLPIPKALLKQGVRDMVRISDARMSGTSYGTCVLHVAPESAAGGPLAFVRDGDRITLDVAGRLLAVDIDEEEFSRRRSEWTQPPKRYTRGYGHLLENEITQACDGCDFRFLQSDGSQAAEPDIY